MELFKILSVQFYVFKKNNIMIKKIIIAGIILCCLILASSCSNMRYGTNAGVNVTWGPNGPKLRPHVDFDIFNGGRL